MSVGSERTLLQVVLNLGAGGTEQLVIAMSLRLAAQARVEVVCLDDPGEWAPRLQDAGVPVTALHREAGFRPGLARHIRRIARGMPSPVLHCHHYSPFIYGGLASIGLPGGRLVYTEHGRWSDGPPSPKRRIANALFARLPGAFFAVSADLRRYMIDEGFPGRRVRVCHNGIEPGEPPGPAAREQARQALGLPAQAWLAGTVARLDPVKDLGTLLEAGGACAADMPDLHLLLVGDGPERAALERMASSGPLAGRVHFAGHRDDARALLPALDVYVNCSVIEGISVTVLEAMAAARSIIATAVGGTPEILADGEQGLLIPSRSPAALAAALRRLRADPDLAAGLARAARQHVVQAFSMDAMLARYLDAYGWA